MRMITLSLLMTADVILYLLMYTDVSSLLIGIHFLFLAIKSFPFILIYSVETLSQAIYFIFINTYIIHSTYLTSNEPII